MNRRQLLPLSIFLLGLLGACAREPDVSLYVALDQEHSERLIDRYAQETGVDVKARFDTEASKTIGLVSAIIEEAGRPRCDVFWNNELAQTVRLGQKGLLTPYVSPSAADLPARWKDPGGLWTGFAARARIFIVNRNRIPNRADYPTSLWDLIDPKWKGQCGVARPLTGTTLTHFAALHQVLGEAEFERFLTGLEQNEVRMMESNGATMRAVRDGDLAFAFTDTDDFHVALQKGHPVDAVFPDQGEGQIGTMLIPNSVAIVKDAPHLEQAKRLVDYVLSAEVEALLAAGSSAQIPLRPGVAGPKTPQIKGIGDFRPMQWDPAVVAASLGEMSRRFAERFAR